MPQLWDFRRGRGQVVVVRGGLPRRTLPYVVRPIRTSEPVLNRTGNIGDGIR